MAERTILRSEPAGTERRPVVSLVVLGCSLLILVSLAIPGFEPPFGGIYYVSWLAGGTAALGFVANRRREPGAFARAGLVCALLAAGLLILSIVFPCAISLALHLTMPN
jgi:hypothetical protein